MKRKNKILFLLFVLIVQISFVILPTLAQTDKDIQEIIISLENFFVDFSLCDFDSLMSKISARYHGVSFEGNEIDYTKFKTITKANIDGLSKKYIENSITNLQILKSYIQNDEVTVLVQYSWKRFNLETAQDESIEPKNLFSLVKENGSWKITVWKIRIGEKKE